MKLADFALDVLDHGEFQRFGIGEFRMRAGMAPCLQSSRRSAHTVSWPRNNIAACGQQGE
jgi:hypothetical protein